MAKGVLGTRLQLGWGDRGRGLWSAWPDVIRPTTCERLKRLPASIRATPTLGRELAAGCSRQEQAAYAATGTEHR